MTDGTDDQYTAVVLDIENPADSARLEVLRSDPGIEFLDTIARQRAELSSLRPAAPPDVVAEPGRWAYLPWRRLVVGVLGPRGFGQLRLDRNRNLITHGEQEHLRRLRIGVVGLSVGHAIAHTLATQGLCGALRLADFDEIDLSNLNRVPATITDVGVNKAVVCARRLAELDPYLPVSAMTSGITADTVDDFLDGLDIVVEECDSLDAKVLVRTAARARGIPVLMATSSGGLLDVERFDAEPHRPILHGLLGDIDAAQLAGLSTKDKVPRVLKVIDASELPSRMAASLIEVGKTLTTWPQLSSEVSAGAASVAEAVRRIGLGEPLSSGRVRVDVPALLDGVLDPTAVDGDRSPLDRDRSPLEEPRDGHRDAPPAPDTIGAVAGAAMRAPSGGNIQPWFIEEHRDAVSIRLDPTRTSAMDVAFRGSAVAVGAAAFNARVAAAAHGSGARVTFSTGDQRSPLTAEVTLIAGDGDPDLATLHPAMQRRETNRHHGTRVDIAQSTITVLSAAAEAEGAHLHLLTDPRDIDTAASILSSADRIRYLTPHLHAQMIDELRWPGDAFPDTGIEVRSLELHETDLVLLDILRRGDVMSHLARWDAGSALGDDSYTKVAAAAAVGVVTVEGGSLRDYARAGSAVESVWIRAQQHGLAVQPVSPAFLYAADDREFAELSPTFADVLADLQYTFRKLVCAGAADSLALVLRFAQAPSPSVISRRRGRAVRSSS